MTLPRCLLSALALLIAAGAGAEGIYKYRDEQGNWVFSDVRPPEAHDVELLPSPERSEAPEVRIVRRLADDRVELVAANDCFCPAEVALRLLEPVNVVGLNEPVRRVADARAETLLATLRPGQAQQPMSFGYEYRAVLGEPGVSHQPSEAYRAPFALAQKFQVSQAFPTRITHVDPASIYAVDIAMPVGTQVYAARGGTVIEVASQYFEGSSEPDKATHANVVRVLHPDGTMSLYAHLNWDSIRVRAGQVVKRGEYIANSGNTGFTTGPHLHFVVLRNAGLRQESLPVEFAGPGGGSVTPQTGQWLEAY